MTTFQKALIALLALVLIPTMVGVFTLLGGHPGKAEGEVISTFILVAVFMFFGWLVFGD